MRFTVLVYGSPVWNESSLVPAMEIGSQYAGEGCQVEIVARNASELLMWRFDHARKSWVQAILKRAQKRPAPAEELGIAA